MGAEGGPVVKYLLPVTGWVVLLVVVPTVSYDLVTRGRSPKPVIAPSVQIRGLSSTSTPSNVVVHSVWVSLRWENGTTFHTNISLR